MTVSAPRRIVFVAPFALEPRGTVKARMIPIARELQARGHDVTIVVPPWDNPEYSGCRMESDGVDIVNVQFEGGVLEHVRVVRRLVSAVQALGPDLVHVFKPVAHAGIVAVVLSQFRRLGVDCPVVLDSDDWEGDGGQNERSRRTRLEELVMHYQEQFVPRVVDAVTVASRTLETQMWGAGIDPEKVFYAPNGQDSERFKQTDTTLSDLGTDYNLGDGPVVLLYTRFFEYDLARIVEVFRQVRERVPNIQFVIVGEGRDNEEQMFGHLAESAGIGESVHLTGWVEFKELPVFFEIADVAVYPFDDTLVNRAKCPVKLTELMLAGQCIVTEDVGQIREYLVNGQSGLLSPPGHSDAFADNLIRAVRSPQLQQRLGSNARKRILKEFAWGDITTEIEFAYEYAI